MSGQWYQSSNESLERVTGAVSGLWQAMAKPARARRIRQLVALLLLIWATMALVELIWTFLPRSESVIPAETPILNPMESHSGDTAVASVNVDSMMSWHLFGVAGESEPAADVPVVVTPSDRDGIEKGARETRLALKLRGVVAATEDGLGYAIIEHSSSQEVYAVGDKLPLGGQVTLAKVLPGSVVLDNSGTYELLKLFEETTLLEQLPADSTPKRPTAPAPKSRGESSAGVTGGGEASVVARDFRRQLYENPQSLAEIVRVSAVRENNILRGYRIDPGKNSAQFTQLGFRAGDVVTSVNGISLENPGNTMQLYQLMRSASEAVFDVERGGENLTLSVSLDEMPSGG